MTTSDDCQYCAYLRDGLPGGWIYEDEHWAAGGFPLNPVPGWIVVMLRRHVEALTDLTGPELATLGPTAARVSSAITHVVEPTKVYFVVFGELNAHFHFLLAPRTADMQPDHRSAVLLTNSRQYADPKRASDIAGRVGALLAGPAR